MVQFIDFRKMLVSVNTMLNTFYATELMVHLAKNVEDAFSRAGECFRNDLLDFQREINKKYAGILFSYLVASVAGELRHLEIELLNVKWWKRLFGSVKVKRQKATVNYLKCSGIDFKIFSRQQVQDAVIENLLNSNPERFLVEAINGFSNFKWGNSTGGAKWAEIAKATLQYARGELADVRFIDLVFTLRHHGNRLFDKHRSFNPYEEGGGTNENTLHWQLEIQSTAKGVVELITKLSETHNGFEWYLIQLMQRGENLKYWPPIAALCKEDTAIKERQS